MTTSLFLILPNLDFIYNNVMKGYVLDVISTICGEQVNLVILGIYMNGSRLLTKERKSRMTKTKIIDLKLKLGKKYKGRVRTKQAGDGLACHLDIEDEGEYYINIPVWLDNDYAGPIIFSIIGSDGHARLVPYNTRDKYVKTSKTEADIEYRSAETLSNEHILIDLSRTEKFLEFARENLDSQTVDFIEIGLKNSRIVKTL